MKKVFIFIVSCLLVTSLFTCCDGESERVSGPEFETAKVSNDAKNEIIVDFSKPIYTTADGFTIFIEDGPVNILSVTGSGSSRVTFVIDVNVLTGEEVTISYNPAEGDANDSNGKELRSFTNEKVNNYVEKLSLMISLPTIPPEMKDNEDAKVWLVLRTDEDANIWAWDHRSALVNESLTAEATKTPFDLIVYITDDADWRPHNSFGSGYYATKLNLTSDDIQLKVVTWVKANVISGTDMGKLIEINQNQENISFEKAFELLTDSADYLESNINADQSLWYKFYSIAGEQYNISLYDYYTDNNNFTGAVEAVIMDRYKIEIDDLEPVLSGHHQTITGNGEYIYLEVKVTDRGGKPGNFQVQVVKQ